MSNIKNFALWVIIALLLVALFNLFQSPVQQTSSTEINFSRLLSEVDGGNIRDVTIAGENITGHYTDGRSFRTYAPADPSLVNRLYDKGVSITAKPADDNVPSILGILVSWFPMLLLIGVWIFFMRQMQGGGGKAMGFGKSKAKLLTERHGRVTFDDVAGIDEAKDDLTEIVEFLRDPAKFQRLGGRIPKGVLLVGPPGTGKTLLARAIAGEANVPFFTISGSDFVEMFVGVGASRVRDMFEQAKKNAPCIIFIDEIDAVGRHRGAGLGGGNDEREQTLNQLLVEMDGFEPNEGIILIAATNRPDVLDPALLRPGRFDRQVVVDRPDREGRRAILDVHARGKPLADGVDLDVIARRTPGFTGADLGNLMNEAALLSARHGLDRIGLMQLEEAIDRVMAGPERRSRLISEREKQVIAYHEAGHALVAHSLPHTDPVHKVSIIPRGRALGYTLTLPVEDRFLVTRSELVDELAMLLGGRTAEELVFSDPTTGAQNDIERATTVARRMVTEYGMSDVLGPVRLGQAQGEVFLGRDLTSTPDYSESVASRIDTEVRALVDAAHRTARGILEENRAVLDALSAELVDKETLDTERVQELLAPASSWKRSDEPAPDAGTGRASAAAAAPDELGRRHK